MRLEFNFGVITQYKADCIVNAARTSLLGGIGVDCAIHRATGSELSEFTITLGGCNVGKAKLNPAFNLPLKFIIHTVGPRNLIKNDSQIIFLKDYYLSYLVIAINEKFESLVFSNISVGAYGFPKKLAAKKSFEVVGVF